MFKKYLIIASKQDLAGMNIVSQLSQFGQYDVYLVEGNIVYDTSYDKPKLKDYDFIIFASKHQSTKGEKSLSVHAPGNWRGNDYGGEKGKVCPTSSQFLKQTFETLNKNAEEHGLTRNYQVTLEATHHGPLIDKPCIFIEIGSSEIEWKDKRAGFVLAKTIANMIENFKVNPYNENVIALGGPHYCPGFNKIQLKSNIAISHVIAQYAFPISEEIIKEAIGKTKEELDFVLLDWKGLGNAQSRQQVIEVLDKLHLRYEKTSKINKTEKDEED